MSTTCRCGEVGVGSGVAVAFGSVLHSQNGCVRNRIWEGPTPYANGGFVYSGHGHDRIAVSGNRYGPCDVELWDALQADIRDEEGA